MGKKRSSLRSTSKGIINTAAGTGSSNNGANNNKNTHWASSASSPSSSAIPATHADSSSSRQQQQLMQSLFQVGNSSTMPSTTTSADAAEKWAFLTEMVIAGTNAAAAATPSSGGNNNTSGIIFPGGGGEATLMMCNNTNSSSSGGMMMMMSTTAATGNSSHGNHRTMIKMARSEANNATTITSSSTPNDAAAAAGGGSAQSIGLQLEALAALMAQQQNNPALKISVTSSSGNSTSGSNGGGLLTATSGNGTNKHSGKKRSSRNTTAPTTTTTAAAAANTSSLNHGSVNITAPMGKMTAERMKNFHQYLKVIADSYQQKLEQEQKDQTQKQQQQPTTTSTTTTTPTTATTSSRSRLVSREHHGDGGNADAAPSSSPNSLSTKNDNESDAMKTNDPTVAPARAPTTTTNAAKRKQSPNTYYPRDSTTATNTNFDPSNHHYLHHNSNNNNNNSTEELQSLLPLFAELVSLTNKIVAAQENGDVAQVDAATSQLCQKVLKDEQAMSMLGVAMKEMNNNKQYPKGGGDGDDNGDGVGRSSNGLRTTESHAFVEGNDVVAGLNDLLHGRSIYGSTTTTTTTSSGTRSKNNGGASTRSPATRKEEMERRRTNSMLAEKNEAIRKLAALGASMQTNGTTASESAGGGGAGTPTFSFAFGGESSTSYPNTSTSSGFGPMLPPFFVPSVGEAAVPPPFLPPPPGGWPPNTAQAAAAAAAMAAFSSSVGYACPGLPGAPSPTFADTTAYLLSDPCLRQIPIPIVSVGGSLELLNSAEWSEYFDAYLRDRGVNGGLEELARLSSQGAAMTASMSPEGGRNDNGSTTASGASGGHCHRPVLPQDRSGGFGDTDDVDYIIPAGFEYDEGRKQSQKSLEVGEGELRTKRAAKKRDKKARQKERAKKEAEVKAALAAMKKREKAITSWRSRVVAACLAGDSRRMEVLVEESPFKNYVYDPKSLCYDEENDNDDHDENGTCDDRPESHEEYISKQMEWFLSNCLQKYRYPPSSSSSSSSREFSKQEPPHEQNIARKTLAEYILSVSFDIVLQQSPSSQNRNAIHSAAYMDDVDFIRWVILRQPSKAKNDVSYLECRCLDGGWTPLHYATAGGAKNVVELLLHAGVCVTARTDSSLTCFKSRRGNGITARELAIALQSGAVKDKIMSESDVLRNIVKYQLGNASTDKVAYLKNLHALETRLANVEKYGYSPLLEKADDGYQGNRVLVPAEKVHSVDVQRSTSASTSQTSKKKKKQQQQTRANTKSPPLEAIATCSNSNSAPSTVKDEDLTDPVAVALLGMGFSDDQIKSAARALGGFERATADDMVAWILGEGKSADNGNSPNASNDNQSASLSETQEKSLPRANADQPVKASNAELAARKRQEEIAAAKRALEKREEQRRIRREWNEREQARQMQEKSAKIAAAMSRRHEVENAKLAPELGIAGVGVPPSTVSVASIGASGDGIGKKHHHDAGPPLTIFAGGPKSMPAKSKNVASNMGIPQAPTLLRTPKILTRPLHPPAHSKPQSLGAAGNQPLFAPSPSLSSAKPSSASPPRNIFAKSTHPSIRNDQPTAILRKESSAGVTNQNQGINTTSITRRILPRNSGHLGTSGLAINDSESLGVSTSVANSASTQILRRGIAPPGFVDGGSTHHRLKPSATEEAAGAASSSSFVETNPLGMIRATAREFVPTYFNPSSTTSTPPDSFLPVSSNTVPSMSAQFMSSRPSTTSPPPLTRTESNDDLMFEHVSSLLSTFGAESGTPTVQSVTSSITGPSGMVTTATTNNNTGDENNTATSRVGSIIGGPFAGGVGGGSGIQTSSIFESILYHSNQESTNLALGSGIWGTGSSNVNQSSSIGLAGLNLSSFMGGV